MLFLASRHFSSSSFKISQILEIYNVVFVMSVDTLVLYTKDLNVEIEIILPDSDAIQCSSEISEHRIRVPYAGNTRMRIASYAYAYSVIRVCPAFVIHCHTFALCGVVLHNKRNGKVKATTRSTKFE